LQACVAWGIAPADVLLAFARSRCKQRVIFAVFKALCGDGVCRCSFPLLPFQCFFQAPVDGDLWKEEDDQSALQCNFIFFVSLCVRLSFLYTVICFPWYESDMSTPIGCLSKKYFHLISNPMDYTQKKSTSIGIDDNWRDRMSWTYHKLARTLCSRVG
jgi:hypothetical protein